MSHVASRIPRKLLKTISLAFLSLLLLLSFCLPVQAADPEPDPDGHSLTGQPVDVSIIIGGKSHSAKMLLESPQLDSAQDSEEETTANLSASETVIFSEGFEGDFPGTQWQVDPASGPAWDTTVYKYKSGNKSAWCAASTLDPASSNYPSGMDTIMVTESIDLSQYTGGTLSFYRWVKTQIATPPNILSGDTLRMGVYVPEYSNSVYGYVFTEKTGSWQSAAIDLTKWYVIGNLCRYSEVYFFFEFVSNTDAVVDKGAFVDDFKITVKGPNAPSRPTLLSPKNGATKVGLYPELSWKGAGESYALQIAADAGFSDILLDEEDIGDTSYEVWDDILAWNTKYFWRVNARNSAGGTSDWSSVFNFKTAVGPPPDPPSDLAGEAISAKQVHLLWWDNSDNESGFYIERKKESDASFKQIGKVNASTLDEEVQYTDANKLTANTIYFYRVCSYNAAGNSDYCDEISVNTLTSPPPKPTLLLPKNGATKVGLDPEFFWKGEGESYGLQIATDAKFSDILQEEEDIGDTSFEVGKDVFEWNTKYYWRVNARNSAGSASDWSSVFNFMTAVGPPPEEPFNLDAEPISSSQVQLTWSSDSDNESGFYIERKKSSEAETKFTQVAKVAADVTEYLDKKGLSAGTDYEYRVRAYNATGNSDYTNIAQATTWPVPPNAPVLVSPANSAKVDGLDLTLSWKAPTKGEVEYYELQVASNSKFTDPEFDDSGITDTSYELWGLDPSTTYYWHVRAVDRNGGTSPWSSTRNFKTPLGE
jgi:hypothetical protein